VKESKEIVVDSTVFSGGVVMVKTSSGESCEGKMNEGRIKRNIRNFIDNIVFIGFNLKLSIF